MQNKCKELWLFSQPSAQYGGTNQVKYKAIEALSRGKITYRQASVTGLFTHEEKSQELYFKSLPLPVYVNNLLAGMRWKKHFSKGSVGLIVSGSAVPGAIPFASNMPYVMCIATTLFAEHVVRNSTEELSQGNYSLAFNRTCLGFNKIIEKRVLRKAKFIISLSPYLLRSLKEVYGIDEKRVAYLPYPVLPCKRRKEMIFNKKGPRLLAVGSLNDNRKNYPFLLQSLNLFIRKYPDTRLRIVGSFSPGIKPLRVCEQLKLNPFVDFLGAISNEALEKEFKNTDIFVLTPRQEGLGIVYLEAMAHGVPVVTTDCGGPREIITNDINGYLVNQGDPTAFCDSLEKVWLVEERYQRFSDAAYQYIEKNHDPESFNEKFLSILHDHLGVG